MKYHIITYGCQMNKSDSERIAGALNKLGFRMIANPERADLIVFNLCSVRQSAIDRATSKIKNFAKSKIQISPARIATRPGRVVGGNVKSNPKSKILLTGCILNKDKRRLEKNCDGVFRIDELAELPSILEKLGFKVAGRREAKVGHYLDIKPDYGSSPIAYIPIMTGCDNFCSYCVVPYTRGREISRPAEDILREIKTLVHPVRESKGMGCSKKSNFFNGVKMGAQEIWLLGQNVNSYKSKIQMTNVKSSSRSHRYAKRCGRAKSKIQKIKNVDFTELLKMVNDIEGDFWVRFTSSHPKDLTDEMIEAFAKCKKITPYLNLPIQSGDNKILKAMNRPYSTEDYKKLTKKVRAAFKKYRKGLESYLALSTDVIVGFPGETKKQFQNTKKTFQEIGFSAGYVSRYSPRPNSAAFKLKDDVSPSEKRKREKKLVKIIEKSALDFNKQFVGKKVKVLALEKRKDFFLGKTRHHQTIKFPSNKNLIGKFIKVKILKATAYGLEGEKY
ncbi:MiaB/RimO family radical SAM methylthiotransferase [Patescibacteria group bacterium]|nr:MiaB/RimO family radical SAM methylthiotransferase [Patescibacteria group bacterium]